jgi:coenzyme PQQ synthesis protein D (PqqD)
MLSSSVEFQGRVLVPGRFEVSSRKGLPADLGKGVVSMVSFADHVAVPAHVLVRFLDNESVFLNLESECYFGLDQTGTRMWQLVTAAPSIDAAYQQLLDEYDVAPELLRLNFTELLSRLVDNGLLELFSSDVGTASAI